LVEKINYESFLPFSDNNLINGKMNYNCTLAAEAGRKCTPNAGVSKFRFQSGKKHRLRLMNTGAEGMQRFTIDNHKMTVIANDFIPVKPYEAKVVSLGVGQRTDIIVEGTGKPTDAVWMRSDISKMCSLSNQSYALAAIYYEDADTDSTPTTSAVDYEEEHCGNDPLNITEPFYVSAPPPVPDVVRYIDVDFGMNETKHMVWSMNNESFRANFEYV
jgi:FtsP/CotA-like multicopper oxidase with cupredoxin domain